MAMYRWTRLSSQKWEEEWTERLQFLGPGHVVMLTWPESRALKIEAFCDQRTAEKLVSRFGGKATQLASQVWTGQADIPRAPIPIRGRLRIFSDEKQWKAAGPREGDLFVPAGMAFGTGDHATTATCLRLLCDIEKKLPAGWKAIDAGCGSGILAIAAEKLGAARVDAFDFDPACVRITRENAKTNGCRRVHVKRADARDIAGFGTVRVILANLFSELLMSSAPGFVEHLEPGGWLVFSGVLQKQSAEVARALRKCGFRSVRIVPRGKWCAGVAAL